MNYLEDLAIILKKGIDKDGNTYFTPVQVITGKYNSQRDVFEDKDGSYFYHIIENPENYGFCNRISIENCLKDHPHLPVPIIKKIILLAAKKFTYYYNIHEEEDAPLITMESKKKSKEETIFIDKDIISYYLELYPMFLTGPLADILNITVSINPNKEENSSNQNNKQNKEQNIKIDVNTLYKEITSRVVGQDEAIRQILVAIWKQYNSFSNEKSRNILVSGSTGVGKTEIFRSLTSSINVPCVTASATQYTAAGYIGKNVEDMLVSLLERAGGDLKKAENGILIIDEVDKLSETGRSSQVNQRDVQEALLKLIEGATFDIMWGGKLYNFDTSRLLVIAGGSWSRIELDNQRAIGFDKKEKPKEYSDLTPDDFVNNGMIPEFIGRFPIIVKLNELKYDDFLTILNKAKNNILSLNLSFFENNGIEIVINDEAKSAIAMKAASQKYGARSLDKIIETALATASFEIASNPQMYSKLIITPETISDSSHYKLIKRKQEENK